MRYRALACDYDGTLATHGVVDQETVQALRSLVESGRKLLLVTGRELPELKVILPELDLFDYVVSENGGLLYWPAHQQERALAERPSEAFVAELIARGVGPISCGATIVATWTPHEQTVLSVIRDLGLDLQVIFNKGAVMILPSGVNKASGLRAALREMHLSRHNVVAIGDAENDHAFLQYCQVGAATANALPVLKERAEIVTSRDHGGGVCELIDWLLRNDLDDLHAPLERHRITPSASSTENKQSWLPGSERLLVSGPLALRHSAIRGITAELAKVGYQFCQLGWEHACAGEHDDTHGKSTVALGSEHALPMPEEVIAGLAVPTHSVQVASATSQTGYRTWLVEMLDALVHQQQTTSRPHVVLLPPLEALIRMELDLAQLLDQFPSVVLMGDETEVKRLSLTKTICTPAEAWLDALTHPTVS